MTTQIAVRLPEELVEFIDDTVERGRATSRAAFVLKAVEAERRRELAARDAAILAGTTEDQFDELIALATRTVREGLV